MKGAIEFKNVSKISTQFDVFIPLTSDQNHLKSNGRKSFSSSLNIENICQIHQNIDSKGEKPLLLLIEDNRDMACYIGEVCMDKYNIAWASDGKQAIEMAMKHVPDIIICDVLLPELDGFEVTRQLRHDVRTNHIPIVILTSLADIKSKIKGLALGVEAYLTKPLDEQELLLVMDNIHEMQQRWQQRYLIPALGIKQSEDSSKMNLVREAQDSFLGRINEIIEKNLSESKFNIPNLCRNTNMSQSQLYRKVRALTGMSLSAYVYHYRLKRL